MIFAHQDRFNRFEDYGPLYWPGHPQCEHAPDGSIERDMINNNTELEVIGGVEDPNASYSYDDFALVRFRGELYLLESSGCSCPSPSETWRVVHGPATKEELVAVIKAGDYEGYTLPSGTEQFLLEVIDAA